MGDLPTPLVSARWLRLHLGSPDLVLLDARWSVALGAERDAYRSGHIPGARFVDLDSELAGLPGARGRHPLPDLVAFQAAMRAHGLGERSRVVLYDEVTGAAARGWWLLRAAGHPAVSVLDGGLAAYLAAGGALESEVPEPVPGQFTARPFRDWLDADSVASRDREVVVAVDARARARFLGQPSPLDPRPGHLPGAASLPWGDLYLEGRVRSSGEVRRRLAEAGVGERQVVAYCGSGVTACALLLAREAAGLGPGLLYPGSWSEWAADPRRAAEQGGGGVLPGSGEGPAEFSGPGAPPARRRR